MWASAGFLVTVFRPFPFAGKNKDNPIDPTVYTLSWLTQPIALASIDFHFGIGLYWVPTPRTETHFYGPGSLDSDGRRRAPGSPGSGAARPGHGYHVLPAGVPLLHLPPSQLTTPRSCEQQEPHKQLPAILVVCD
jgi:hypothetical protein